MTKDRRRHKRFAATAFLNMPVCLSPIPPYFGTAVKGKLIDLSAGGMALLIEEVIPQGTILNLSVSFPDHSKIDCVVIVKRVGPREKKYLHGIEFLNLPGFVEKKIDKMSSDYIDCEARSQKGAEEICRADCAFFTMCTKPQKKEPVFNVDVALELTFSRIRDLEKKIGSPTAGV